MIRRWASRVLSIVLSAALFALAPGLGCYEALAAVSRKSAAVRVPSGVSVQPIAALPNVSVSLNLNNPGSAANLPALQRTYKVSAVPPGAAPLAAAAAFGPAPLAPAAIFMPQAAEAPAPAGAAASAGSVLQRGAERLSRASDGGEKGAVLGEIYTGAKPAAFDADAVRGRVSDASRTTLSKSSAAEPEALPLLVATANDSQRSLPERFAAVAGIAAVGGEAARASLKAVGRANPEGGAADYEVKRKALHALADLGEVVSLPPVSRAHADAILKELTATKPEAAIFDYDGTLEPTQDRISPETAQALQSVSDAGVETMILTARSDWDGDSVHDSLRPLTAGQKAGLVVGAERGARLSIYDASGQPRIVNTAPAWTADERSAVQDALDQVKAAHGQGLRDGRSEIVSDYGYTLYLPPAITREGLQAALEQVSETLRARGVTAVVTAILDSSYYQLPVVLVSKYDKAYGVKLMRRDLGVYMRLRDIVRKLPAGLQRAASGLARILPHAAASSEKTLVVGDQFLGARADDAKMLAGAPGAMALAVGGTADPRLERAFVWPTQGHAATQEIMAALSSQANDSINKKALGGLFTQRTLSIIAFIATSVAYPFIALPVVGVAGFGALMALGPLAAIATGPLNGLVARKLSARNAMALNTVVRMLLALALPAFSAFGVLNFGTLLVASVANGWLCSSIMTTENIYIKRLAGNNVGAVNALAWINYLAIQVVLGLIVGIGTIIDHFNPMLPYYISAGLHAALILPIVWKTIPNDIPNAASAAYQAAPSNHALRDKLAAGLDFMKKNWQEAALLGVGIGAYFLIGSTIPATLALLYWLSKTDGFKKLWANKPLRYGLMFMMAGAFLFFPLQAFSLPLMAKCLAGAAGKAALLGRLLGALFFGQLISNSSQAKLSAVRVPFLGRVGLQRFIQLGVLGLAAAWVWTGLFPGSVLAVLAALGVSAGLMALSERMTDKGWIQYVGAGLAFMVLPLIFWGNVPALFMAILMIGLFYGPASVALSSYFIKNTPKGEAENVIGVQGSAFNAAISLGFGVVSAVAGRYNPTLPGLMIPLSIAFVLVGLAFLIAPRFMPGLPDKALKERSKVKL
ncbi:MAG: hypothetical protein WC881_01000 [Elusimicrobiota bacterium]|jgi:hypothetical protein